MIALNLLFSLSCALTFLTTVEGTLGNGVTWGNWTECSAECDGGIQARDKFCNGSLCGKVEGSCHIMPCDDPFRGVSWKECSEPCGDDGTRTRSADGVPEPQEIRCNTHSCEPTKGDCIGDVVFVLDSSGSIGGRNWSVSLQFVIDVMKGLKISSKGTHVGVVIYSTTVAACFGLKEYDSVVDIEPVVFNLDYMAGLTNTADGIKEMHKIFKNDGRDKNDATRIGAVITDGMSNVDPERTIPEAKDAQQDDIEMFAVAIGSDINDDEINGIVSNPDYVFHAANYGVVQDLTRAIAEKICKISNTKECDDCGNFGKCIAGDCGGDGIKKGTKECWIIDGRTGKEKPSSRESVPCSEPCVKICAKLCDDCGDFGDCQECGVESVMTGTRECWMVDKETNQEVPSTRKTEPCESTCFVPCDKEECDDCGNFGNCIADDCGGDGIREGTKECWIIEGKTGKEKPSSRQSIPCNEPCVKKCDKFCGDCGDFGDCQECGVESVMTGTKECWMVDKETNQEVPSTRKTEPCEASCFVPCPTTPWTVDCSRCEYTKGQIWLEDRYNCHLYYICEPLGNGVYRVHHGTCGDLFWNQPYHTCVPVMPLDANCKIGPVSPFPPEPTVKVPCPYEPFPGDASKFWISGNAQTVSSCIEGMEFVNMGDLCDCIPVGPLIPQCHDDLLLHFPYEDHYNDVTCHQAIATQYGTGVSIQHDPVRNGNVACFTGNTHFEVAFLRTWFANNKVDKFSVSVWFKRDGQQISPQGIVHNGDCIDTAGFLIGHSKGMVMANITTEAGDAHSEVSDASAGGWYHVAWVYDGQCLKVYVDCVLQQTITMSGYLKNNDVPMYIANCCGEYFFTGCLDELRVYNRVLSVADINYLCH